MIGIVITGQSTDPMIFHRINAKPVIEYTLENCLQSVFAQAVVVAMPALDSVYANGSAFKTPVFNSQVSKLDRKASYLFYGLAGNHLERIHRAALIYQIDTVIIISANCPCLPYWLINEAVEYYSSIGGQYYVYTSGPADSTYDTGFSIEILPFWMLAQATRDIPGSHWDREDSLYLYCRAKHKTAILNNVGKSAIPRLKESVRLTASEQLPKIEFILHEVNMGKDLPELFQELNNESKPDVAQL